MKASETCYKILTKRLLPAVLAVLLISSVSGCKQKNNVSGMNSSVSNNSSTSKSDSSSVSDSVNYVNYTNARFGFSIEYPDYFNADSSSDNGDGITLKSKDGNTKITVSGINNVDSETARENYNTLLNSHNNTLSNQLGDNWYSASWKEGDKVFFEKDVVGSGSVNTFIIQYPVSDQETFKSVVEHMSNSFKTPGVDLSH